MVKLFPSLIAANPLCFEETIVTLDPFVDGYHLDLMDFHFVPNLTLGFDCINAIRKITKKQLSVHLMVDYPEHYLEKLHLHKGDIISFHYESPSAHTPENLLRLIAHQGYIPSVALKPSTPVEKALSLSSLKHLLIMSVEPGFSGQQFIPSSLEKIAQSARFKDQTKASFSIAVDGGITETNCSEVVAHGANELICGSALFKHNDPQKALIRLRECSRKTLYSSKAFLKDR